MLPYESLPSTATDNEANNYAAGRVTETDMFIVAVAALIVIFCIILVIWKILNYINFRKAVDKVNNE